MSNISNINGEVFAFDAYNLNYFRDCDCDISGHYRFWWHKPTNRYVYCKFGDYANLVSIKPVKEDPRFPDGSAKEFLDDLVQKEVRHAYFYDGAASCNHGPFLLDELEAKCQKRNGRGTEWFPAADDNDPDVVRNPAGGYFDHVMKYNCVFDHDYPGPDYKVDSEHFNELERLDKLATEMLGSKFVKYLDSSSSWTTYRVQKLNENLQPHV